MVGYLILSDLVAESIGKRVQRAGALVSLFAVMGEVVFVYKLNKLAQVIHPAQLRFEIYKSRRFKPMLKVTLYLTSFFVVLGAVISGYVLLPLMRALTISQNHNMNKLLTCILIFLLAGSTMASEVIFEDSSGRVLTKDDLKGFSCTASWEIISEKNISQKALDFHGKGREFGQKGNYENSIKNLELAAKEDPNWVYPVYDLAYTYMLMGNTEKAHEFYKKVDQMAPRGFFTVKTAVHTLDGEKEGTFPKGLYMAYLSIEWMDDAKKIEVLRGLSNKVPEFAPVWKELISFAANDEAAMQFIENGLASSPDDETYGMLKINKALILHRNDKKAEAIKILGDLALNPESSMGTEKIAKQTLSYLLDETS